MHRMPVFLYGICYRGLCSGRSDAASRKRKTVDLLYAVRDDHICRPPLKPLLDIPHVE